MPFTIGSTAGVSYDVPTELSADVKFLFEAGIAMVPQMTTDKNNANYSMSVVQQGPNIAILDAGSDEDDLVSWLLIKYLTSMDQYNPDNANANSEGFVEGQNNSARFGISTGYFPVTYSAYNSTLYTEYMSIGKRYYEQGKTTEGFTEREKATLIEDMREKAVQYGFSYDEYFLLHLQGKADDEIKEYISDYEHVEIAEIMNNAKNQRKHNHDDNTFQNICM